jgi:hypothetical protein
MYHGTITDSSLAASPPLLLTPLLLSVQVLSLLSCRCVDILADPDCDVTLSASSSALSAAAATLPDGQTLYKRTVILASSQLQKESAPDASPGQQGKKKLWKLCLDLGLIVRDRRDAIDKLMKGEIDAETSKLSEKLSKKTLQRVILMETCLSGGQVNSVCEYITALDSSRFGYKDGANGAHAAAAHFRYADVEGEGESGGASGGSREATAAGVDVGYVLRDVTRVHQWAALLLDQLRATAKDTILRRFVVPYLLAKHDSTHGGGGAQQITDMPVAYTRELESYIRLCQGTVAVFRALITRKRLEVTAMQAARGADSGAGAGAGAGVPGAAAWTVTSLLDAQCVVAEAVAGVLRVASLACSARGISLPGPRPAEGGGGEGRAVLSPLEKAHRDRGVAGAEYAMLSPACCDLKELTKDVRVDLFSPCDCDGGGVRLLLVQDLLTHYLDRVSRTLAAGSREASGGAGAAEYLLGDAGREGAGAAGGSARLADRLAGYLFLPVTLALSIQRTGLRSAAALLEVPLAQGAGREAALDIFYVPMRHAFASVLYSLLDTTAGAAPAQGQGSLSEDEIFGFAAKFGVACGSVSSSSGGGQGSSLLLPPAWSGGAAALWMLDSGLHVSGALSAIGAARFECFFESRSGAYRTQTPYFLPFAPETLFRYVVCRLLYKGDWRSAKALLQTQLSAGGADGRLGRASLDVCPLLLSAEGQGGGEGQGEGQGQGQGARLSASRGRFLVLSLAVAMLQLDEWQVG